MRLYNHFDTSAINRYCSYTLYTIYTIHYTLYTYTITLLYMRFLTSYVVLLQVCLPALA